MASRTQGHHGYRWLLGVAGIAAIALSGVHVWSQETTTAARQVDLRPLARADIPDPPVISFDQAQTGVAERVRQMQARRAARLARQRHEVRDYTVGALPPDLGLPPRPDAPGGSLVPDRRGGGR